MFDARSLTNLEGVHPDLVKVAMEARKSVAFVVTEGVRSLDRQKQMIAEGKSWLKNAAAGRHVTGHAIDIAALDAGDHVDWDLSAYAPIAVAFSKAAHTLGIPTTWGGNWAQRDACHFELDAIAYPNGETK